MKVRTFLFALFVALSLFGCTSANSTPNTPPSSKTAIPGPESGKASVSGQMITTSNSPLGTTLIRLAKIYGEGKDSIYVINDSDSPGTYTNKEGFFVFSNIDAGSYALLFTDKDGNYRSINKTAEMIFTVDAVANKVTDLGQVRVDLSAPTK